MITEKRFPQLACAASAASSAGWADRMISVIARSPRHDPCEFRCGLQYFALRIETPRRCNRRLAPPRNGGRPTTRAACPWRHSVGVGAKNRVERRLAHRSPTGCHRVAGRYAGRVNRGVDLSDLHVRCASTQIALPKAQCLNTFTQRGIQADAALRGFRIAAVEIDRRRRIASSAR